MIRGILGCWLLLSAPAASPQEFLPRELAVATTAEPSPDTRTTAEEMGLSPSGEVAHLSLEDAVVLALRRNLTLSIERYRRSRSVLGIHRSQGIYDLQLDALADASSDASPPRSLLQLADLVVEDRARANLALSRLVPFGATVRLDYQSSRSTTTDRRFEPNPGFRVDVDLTVTQPLLRGFGRAVTERDLIVARTDAAISREDLQVRVEDVLQQVTDAYWNLVEARDQLRVAEESLELAEELDRMNRKQVEIGTMAALEVVQSEAGVAARKEGIIQLATQVADAADLLRELMNLERSAAWEVEIVPATDPRIDHRAVDLREAIATALAHRPDVRRQRLQNETLALDARVARNRKRPRLDLTATYGFNALDGDKLVRDPDGNPIRDDLGELIVVPAGYGDALQQLYDGDFEGWRVGVEVGVPLQNRAAEAASAEADLAAEQAELELRRLELQVWREVRGAARTLEAAAQRIEIARTSSELARRSLIAEQKRYENGLSTSFEVLQFQEDLSEARSREVGAVLSYRRAETAYYRAIGRLLERYGVVLAGE